MMRMARPAHPGQFIRMEVIEPLNLSVTQAAKALGVTRAALSALLNGRATLSPDMALRIEKEPEYGALYTDFTMIKAGALHRANGGFLVINALDLFRNLFSYDALKRAIRNSEVKIEDVWEQYRSVPAAMMKLSFRVRPRMKAMGAISMVPCSIRRAARSVSTMSYRAS